MDSDAVALNALSIPTLMLGEVIDRTPSSVGGVARLADALRPIPAQYREPSSANNSRGQSGKFFLADAASRVGSHAQAADALEKAAKFRDGADAMLRARIETERNQALGIVLHD